MTPLYVNPLRCRACDHDTRSLLLPDGLHCETRGALRPLDLPPAARTGNQPVRDTSPVALPPAGPAQATALGTGPLLPGPATAGFPYWRGREL